MPLTPIVKNYLLILGSKLVDQDRREAAREAKHGRVNIYRMGLLLEAANKVAEDMKAHTEDGGPEAMTALKRSLSRRFDPDFPPIKSLLKLIDSSPASLVYGPAQKTRAPKSSATKKSGAELDQEIDNLLR